MERTHHRIRMIRGTGVTLLLICTLVGQVSAQTCVQPQAGLVSWWPGDGNFNDIVDANSGTNAGGTTFTTGKVDQAFLFGSRWIPGS